MDFGASIHNAVAFSNNMPVGILKTSVYKDEDKLFSFKTDCLIDGKPIGCNVVTIYSKKFGEAELFINKKHKVLKSVHLQDIKCNILLTESCFKFYDAQKRPCKICLDNSLKLRDFANALCKAGIFVEHLQKLRRKAAQSVKAKAATETNVKVPNAESNVTETKTMIKRSRKVTIVLPETVTSDSQSEKINADLSAMETNTKSNVSEANIIVLPETVTADHDMLQTVTSQTVMTQTPIQVSHDCGTCTKEDALPTAAKGIPSVDSDNNTMESIHEKIQSLAKLTQLPHLCIPDLPSPETTDSLDEEIWTKLLKIVTHCFLCREYFGRVNVVLSSSDLGAADMLLDKGGKFLLRLLLGTQNVTLNEAFIKFRDEEQRSWRLYFQSHNDQQRFLETLRKLGQYVNYGLEPSNLTKTMTSELSPSSDPNELLTKHEDRLAMANQMQQIMQTMGIIYEKESKADTFDEEQLELDKQFIDIVMGTQILLSGHESMEEVLRKYRRPSACLHCKTLLRHNNELKDFLYGINQGLDKAAVTVQLQNERIMGRYYGIKQLSEQKRKMSHEDNSK